MLIVTAILNWSDLAFCSRLHFIEDCDVHWRDVDATRPIFVFIVARNLALMLQRNATVSPGSSDVSISIENALGAFDFLESEDYEGGYGSSRWVPRD